MIARHGMVATMAPLAWRTVAVLVAGSMLVVVLTMSPTDLQPGAMPDARTRPAAAEASAPDIAARPHPAHLNIADRPLFYPTRTPWVRPVAPPPAPVVATLAPLTNYILIGVIVSGSERRALIKTTRDNKTVTLTEGQQLEGWTLHEITRERLRFVAGDASYVMDLAKPAERGR
jgi:hypothetical protein